MVLQSLIGGDNINSDKDIDINSEILQRKEGDGTMAATTQNFVYNYGKKQDGKKEHTISGQKLKEIRDSMRKYLLEKK